MNIYKYINENRIEISNYIDKVIKSKSIRTDEERRLWILNDEYLYNCCKYNISLISK